MLASTGRRMERSEIFMDRSPSSILLVVRGVWLSTPGRRPGPVPGREAPQREASLRTNLNQDSTCDTTMGARGTKFSNRDYDGTKTFEPPAGSTRVPAAVAS